MDPKSVPVSAFPAAAIDEWNQDNLGMTLRDYFASHALSIVSEFHYDQSITNRADHLARLAYEMADAMLKAREV